MSTATVRASRVRDADAEGGSTVWFWLLVLAALSLIGFLVAWLGGWIRFTTDPRVAEILVMQEEARAKYAANGGPSTLVEATAAVVEMNSIRQKIEALPPHLRPQAEQAGGGMMRDVFRGRIDAYFNAPPGQREAELDRQITQEEIMRQAFEAGRTIASAIGGGGQTGSGGGTTNAGGAASGTGGGTAPAAGGPSSGGGPPRGGTEEDRNRWRKNMIDRTTPEERARYAEYRRAMEERREQRGLTTGGPPGGPPPSGPR